MFLTTISLRLRLFPSASPLVESQRAFVFPLDQGIRVRHSSHACPHPTSISGKVKYGFARSHALFTSSSARNRFNGVRLTTAGIRAVHFRKQFTALDGCEPFTR